MHGAWSFGLIGSGAKTTRVAIGGFILGKTHFPRVGTRDPLIRHCQRWPVGISAKNANLLFPSHSIWGWRNSQEWLCCPTHILASTGMTREEGCVKGTDCPAPDGVLEYWSDSAHFPTEKGTCRSPRPMRCRAEATQRLVEWVTMEDSPLGPQKARAHSPSFKELAGFGQTVPQSPAAHP